MTRDCRWIDQVSSSVQSTKATRKKSRSAGTFKENVVRVLLLKAGGGLSVGNKWSWPGTGRGSQHLEGRGAPQPRGRAGGCLLASWPPLKPISNCGNLFANGFFLQNIEVYFSGDCISLQTWNMIFARYNIVRFSDSLPIASGLGNKARYNRES